MLLALTLTVGNTWSQEVTGGLEGRVLNPQGEALAAVNITIRGASLQGVRSATSDEQGYFRVPALPVGSYTVKISHPAHQGVTYEDVSIRLGNTTTLGEVRLQLPTVEMPEIVVSGKRALIDPTSTTLGANLEARTYEALPVDRNFRSIITLIPQANASFLGDEVNISGSTGLANAYFIDGINVTDPFMGFAKVGASTDLPYNFVKEIQIKSGGYEAEFGRSFGGIANVITYSGENDFHGTIFGFFTDHGLAGEYRRGAIEENVGDFSTYDMGFSLHGPVVRDKLWFFAAYNPNFGNRDIDIPGLGEHNDTKTSHLLSGKLTWQAGQNTNLVFTVLGDPSRHQRIGTTFDFPTPSKLENVDPFLGDLKVGGVNLSLKGRHIVGERLFLDASISRFDRNENDVPDTERGRNEPIFADFTTGIWSGGYGRVLENHSIRTASQFSGSLFLGNHTLKAGVEYEDNSLDQVFTNRTGADGQQPGIFLRTGASSYTGIFSHRDVNVHNRVLSGFAQDSWLVGNRLRLNAGFRWDGQYLVGSDGKVAQPITDGYQPRVGLIYQPGALGSQKLFGSYGRFYEPIPTGLSSFFHVQSVYHILRYDQNPLTDPTVKDTFDAGQTIVPELEGLEGQHFDEFTLGYERGMGNDFKFGVRGVYRNLRQVIESGFDSDKDKFVIGNPGKGPLNFLPRLKRRYTALELTLEKWGGSRSNFMASYVLSRSHGNYSGLFESELGREAPHGSSQYSREQLGNRTGLLPNDRTHVFKFFGSYRFDVGLTAGTFLTWQRGTPLNEFGPSTLGTDHIAFLSPRGSAGRTPWIWDLNMRLVYDLARLTRTSLRPKLILDVFHLFSQREVVNLDQLHYVGLDEAGNPGELNPNYLTPTRYQPPLTVRLGMEVSF